MSTGPPDPQPPKLDLDPEQHGSAALGRLARFAAAVAAGVSGAAGIYGVFREGTNSGGVPVLLVVAAFFGYLAISGQRLTRVKIGDTEAGFDRVVNVLSHRVLENPALTVETRGEVAEALEEVSPALSRRTRRVVGAALNAQEMAERYAGAVRRAIVSLYPDDDFTMVTRRPTIGECDALMLRSSDGRRLYLVPRYFGDGELTPGALASVINTYSPDLRQGAVLVIVSNVPPRGSEGTSIVTFGLLELGKIMVATWNGPGDTPELQRALRSAIAVGDASRQP